MSKFRWLTMVEVAWLVFIAGAVVLLPLAGCADSAKFETAMTLLQEGNARGHLVMTTGGSPVQAGMKQVLFLGPENAAMSFDGDIDFAGVSADDLLPEELD